MQNPTRMMFDYDQYIEQPKVCCHDITEVAGEDRCCMIANKG
jgi:hypothetical protein